MQNKIDALASMVQYHEDLSEAKTFLSEMAGSVKTEGFSEMESRFVRFFKPKIEEHFKFEELIIFPALLTAVPAVTKSGLINRLKLEHREILYRCDRIFETLKQPFNQENISELTAHFVALAGALQGHIIREDREAVPLVGKNAGVRFIMSKKYLSLRNQFDSYHF